MVRHSVKTSESWKSLPWKKFQKNLFRLQKRVFKAILVGDKRENAFVKVRGNKSPFDGDLVYWSERNSKLYDGIISKQLQKQNHTCGRCGLRMTSLERVHLHHIDGNHDNWKPKNLIALHESCHDYIHTGNRERK